MTAPISVRRRNAAAGSLRLGQPLFWGDGLSLRYIAGTTGNITITASATTHTVGSWVQLLADTATTETAGLLLLYIANSSAAATDTGILIDLGTGASGSEVVRVQSLAVSHQQAIHTAIPVRIPGSTRVAARIQSSVSSRTCSAQIALITAPFMDRLPLSVDVLGTSTATSVGTAMSGASGSWVEITASTANDYQAIVLVPSLSDTNSGANAIIRYDLGLGLSGSEVAVASTGFTYSTSPTLTVPLATIQPGVGAVYGGYVPSGSRIAVRHNIAANPGRLDACVIGVPYA